MSSGQGTPAARIDSITLELADMNLHTLRRSFVCGDVSGMDGVHASHRIQEDSKNSRSIFTENVDLTVVFSRNLTKSRKDIPDKQFVRTTTENSIS